MPAIRNSFDQVRDWDNAHFFHPWEAMATLGQNRRTFTEASQGIYVFDENGRRLIDAPGGMWCVQVGYGRAELGQAMAEQATKMAYFSPYSMSNSTAAELARKIAERTPGDLNKVFFTTGGSTAVDTAIRFVQYRNNVLGAHDKKIVISRQKAYHGSTYLSATLSGKDRDRSCFDFASDLVHFLPDVNPYRRPEGMSLESFLDAKVADLESAILTLGPDRVAAFIAEPILASGGVIIPPKGYHRRCLEVCRKYDVLYISDEVVTGFGRLGHWFASEDVFGITPDIITSAKGLTSGYVPLGACIISDRLVDDISGAGAKDFVFSTGYTYSGHPVGAAVALKNIEIIEREGILEHVRAVTPHFQQRLAALAELPIVGDVRGQGLMGCVECVADRHSKDPLALDKEVGSRIDAHCQELGLIVRPLINMCVFSPPLVITRDEIDQMFDILTEGIRRASDELAREGLWAA